MIQENQEQELELEETPEVEEATETEEKVEEKKPELTLEQRRGILKRQLTKVEKELGIVEEKPKPKESEAPKTSEREESLTPEEVLVLVGAGVTKKEDINEVVAYARYKKILLEEALKSNIVKNTLKENEEFRKTAEATNTAISRKGASKVSGEDLLEKFKKGDIPEKEEDLQKVIEQRWTPKEK